MIPTDDCGHDELWCAVVWDTLHLTLRRHVRDSALHSLPQVEAYHPALLALALLCLVVLIQSFLAGVLGLGKSDEVPGVPLKGNHSDLSFRILRTYANSTENLAVMIATTFLAIIAGVSAFLVNWLAGLHLAFRLAYWAVYYSGIGSVESGARTVTYVLAFLMNAVLALLTVYALLI